MPLARLTPAPVRIHSGATGLQSLDELVDRAGGGHGWKIAFEGSSSMRRWPHVSESVSSGSAGAPRSIAAFHKNPHTDIVALVGRDVDRVHATLAKNGQSAGGARVSTRFEDLLEADDVHVIDIATPNDLHAAQAVAAARAGKHILLEKPTGLTVDELIAIRDAVRAAGVRTIVSFELRYNPWLRFIRWMRESGRLGRIHFARTNYLSRVTDWGTPGGSGAAR